MQAVPTNLFCTNFRLQQDDRLVGEVDPSIWRDTARLELEDGSYELYRERFCAGDFLLEQDGRVIARASKPSVFKCRFEVELPNRRGVVLRKLSPWNRRFGLFDGENQIGSVYPLGLFARRTQIDLPSDWPLATRSFLFWLAFLMWKRQNAAAAS